MEGRSLLRGRAFHARPASAGVTVFEIVEDSTPAQSFSTPKSLMERDQVALVLQTALLGEVSPALRGVGFALEDDNVRLLFYYDGVICDEDRESASTVETEVMAGLGRPERVTSEVIRFDTPKKLPDPDCWVYRRRE